MNKIYRITVYIATLIAIPVLNYHFLTKEFIQSLKLEQLSVLYSIIGALLTLIVIFLSSKFEQRFQSEKLKEMFYKEREEIIAELEAHQAALNMKTGQYQEIASNLSKILLKLRTYEQFISYWQKWKLKKYRKEIQKTDVNKETIIHAIELAHIIYRKAEYIYER
ncbi:hypothetical protein NUH30_19120 [Leptospira sp. 85282-16]|uniref:hypothetical protein n=1 Tax=Leptospira sp. 85282-16 TaxID=2971256 RepID=UPI0021BE302F|nr:hypothetical protein [Leptospira sp. 85282-16]MCT8335806.1 hypothetical protein [Leptospira sp. 85282-16]